ncbi:beta-eliminating lyase-related protein [Alishewanella longhuensis]
MSICLSKGLGAPIGSLLLGSHELIKKAKRVRKMLGGGMRKTGLLAAAGHYALQNHIDRLAEDHANARLLADGLAALAGQGRFAGLLSVQPPQTNILFTDLPAMLADELVAFLASKQIQLTSSNYASASGTLKRIRWVCH